MHFLAVRRVSIPVGDSRGPEPARGPTVVLVTGDANLRAAAARCLEETGCTVVRAAHAGHALLACLTTPTVDVLVSELAMDDTSGPALAQGLRRHHPGLRTVYLASAGASACEGVIVRPFTRDELVREVAIAAAAATSPPA